MEIATSELLRHFNGSDLAIQNISILLRLCAEGLQHEAKRLPDGKTSHAEIDDLQAVAWLASVQTTLTEIGVLENDFDVSFDTRRPEWDQQEGVAK